MRITSYLKMIARYTFFSGIGFWLLGLTPLTRQIRNMLLSGSPTSFVGRG